MRLAARLTRAERTASGCVLTCATCATWPDVSIAITVGDTESGPRPWPESLQCPDCGRQPRRVQRVVIGQRPDGPQ